MINKSYIEKLLSVCEQKRDSHISAANAEIAKGAMLREMLKEFEDPKTSPVENEPGEETAAEGEPKAAATKDRPK